jgi:hypothetical protein
MNHYYAEIQETPIDPEAQRKRTVEVLLKEEAEIDKRKTTDSYGTVKGKPFRVGYATTTYENKYHHDFRVPSEVYSIEKYREKLNNAKTLDEVERIIRDYLKHY